MRLYFAIVRQNRHVSANNLRRCRTSQKSAAPPLVETSGLEPPTSCMSSMRSDQLSYASVKLRKYIICVPMRSYAAHFHDLHKTASERQRRRRCLSAETDSQNRISHRGISKQVCTCFSDIWLPGLPGWWRQRGSNPRPHACEACALTN